MSNNGKQFNEHAFIFPEINEPKSICISNS